MTGDNGSREDRNSLPILLTSAVVGAVSGSICVAIRFGLRFLQWLLTGHSGLVADAASHLPLWRRIMTPVLGAILATCVAKLAQRFRPVEKSVDYVEAVQFDEGRIPFEATAWRTISSAFSIGSGAAIGREGSMIQFAASAIAALGSRWAARVMGLKRLVLLGTAAAVASVYQAPFAGVFFALEIVLGVRLLSRQAIKQMPAVLISAAAGALMSAVLLGTKPLFATAKAVQFTWHDCVPVGLAAILIGSFGPVYFQMVQGLRFLKKLPWAMVWSGIVVGALSCVRPETWGNGDSGVLEVMGGTVPLKVTVLVLVLRLGATAACVGSGVVGGVFTPTVFAGSVLGLLCGSLSAVFFSHASPATGFAVLGIACLLASVTHAPVMAALMTVELTGSWPWFPIVLLCSCVSFWIAKSISPNSLYAVAAPDPANDEQRHSSERT